LYFCRCGNG